MKKFIENLQCQTLEAESCFDHNILPLHFQKIFFFLTCFPNPVHCVVTVHCALSDILWNWQECSSSRNLFYCLRQLVITSWLLYHCCCCCCCTLSVVLHGLWRPELLRLLPMSEGCEAAAGPCHSCGPGPGCWQLVRQELRGRCCRCHWPWPTVSSPTGAGESGDFGAATLLTTGVAVAAWGSAGARRYTGVQRYTCVQRYRGK